MSQPSEPRPVLIPRKLLDDLMGFINRRMERDRWLYDQYRLREGIEDCIDPQRRRAMDRCHLCAGTGKDFDNKDRYRGECPCVRPANQFSDSYAALLNSAAGEPSIHGGESISGQTEEVAPKGTDGKD
jgi:hypothetical protein